MIDNMITVYNKTIVGDYREAIVTPEVDGIKIQEERGIVTPVTPYNYDADNWFKYVQNYDCMNIYKSGNNELVYNWNSGSSVKASTIYYATLDKRIINKIKYNIQVAKDIYSEGNESYQPCIGLKTVDQIKNYTNYDPTDNNWIKKARGMCWQEEVWDEEQHKYVKVWRHSTSIVGEFDITNLNTECMLCMCAHGCDCTLTLSFEKED